MRRNVWSSILLIALVAGLAYGLYATSPKWLPAAQGAFAKPTPTPSEDQLAGQAAKEGMTILLNPYADSKTGTKAWVDKVCGMANGPACALAVSVSLADTPTPGSSNPYRMTVAGEPPGCVVGAAQKLDDFSYPIEIGRDPYPAQTWRVQLTCKKWPQQAPLPPLIPVDVVKLPGRGWAFWSIPSDQELAQRFPQGTPTFAPNEMMTPTP